MSTIVTRNGKGSPLTFDEADDNFTNLNNDKAELSDLALVTGAGLIGYDAGETYAVGTVGEAIQSGGGGGNSFTFSATPPTIPPPVPGDHWVSSTEGVLYTYVDDGITSQWVDFRGS
jgi:hypothetical protein